MSKINDYNYNKYLHHKVEPKIYLHGNKSKDVPAEEKEGEQQLVSLSDSSKEEISQHKTVENNEKKQLLNREVKKYKNITKQKFYKAAGKMDKLFFQLAAKPAIGGCYLAYGIDKVLGTNLFEWVVSAEKK